MNIIKRPVLTEKTLNNYKNLKHVTFEVDQAANKISASQMVEKLYGVKVKEARVNNRLGKYKLNRKDMKYGKQSDKKIMVFRIGEKDSIDLFEAK